MQKQSRGKGLLVLAVLSGSMAIVVLAFGMYAIWHTNNNVQIHRDIVERRTKELAVLQPVLHLPGNFEKAEQLRRMIDFDRRNVYDYEEHVTSLF